MHEKKLGDYIVTVDKINKTFPNGVCALRDFSTKIRRSEVVVIIGPSGSGKSTFLRCLNGLEEIDSGSIIIDGIPLDEKKKNRLRGGVGVDEGLTEVIMEAAAIRRFLG